MKPEYIGLGNFDTFNYVYAYCNCRLPVDYAIKWPLIKDGKPHSYICTCEDCGTTVSVIAKSYGPEVYKEMEEDAISRKAVLDAISELNAVSFYEAQEDSKECYYEIRNAIKQLSSVKPVEKTGYWTDEGFCGDYICSVCKNEIDSDVPNMRGFTFELPRYCPNCGANMEVKK